MAERVFGRIAGDVKALHPGAREIRRHDHPRARTDQAGDGRRDVCDTDAEHLRAVFAYRFGEAAGVAGAGRRGPVVVARHGHCVAGRGGQGRPDPIQHHPSGLGHGRTCPPWVRDHHCRKVSAGGSGTSRLAVHREPGHGSAVIR